MRRRVFPRLLMGLLALCASATSGAAPARARPNILLILADDLGYSDIEPFGGELHTPNLDRLAGSGRLMTSFYATSMPISRAEVLTGTDHHLVGVGSLEPATRKQIGVPAYQGFLSDNALPVSTLLRAAGYHTYMVGTWHLGSSPGQGPEAKGFEQSFALLEAAGMYFPPRRQEPLPAGAEVWPTYQENGHEARDPNAYVTDFFTDKLIEYIDAHRGDGAPFFGYASYTAPHFPLQAPAQTIERYRGRYDAGYEAVRQARWARQQRTGLFPAAFRPAATLPDNAPYPRWEQLSARGRHIEARRMEIYAAMIDNLDANIGRLLDHLRVSGQLDNTLIIFTSGNGAAQGLGGYPEDLDISTMGGPKSWLFYSERWAEVSNTPFRLWKGKPTEGGISVPTIIRLPGQVRGGAPLGALATLQDLAPTFLDYAGVAPPGPTFQGKPVLPMTGKSLRALWEGRQTVVHGPTEVIADEESGEGYVRRGAWKALRMTDTAINLIEPGDAVGNQYTAAIGRNDTRAIEKLEAAHPPRWSLFNIEADRSEQHDLAAQRPEVLLEMRQLYDAYRSRVGALDW